MSYLLSQILFSLIAAGVVGGSIGWILHGYKAHQREQNMQDAMERQGMVLAQAQSERQMIADEYDDMKQHLENKVTDLHNENQQIPALVENLENSQTLGRQNMQRYDHELTELHQQNQRLTAELDEVSRREQNQLAEIAALKIVRDAAKDSNGSASTTTAAHPTTDAAADAKATGADGSATSLIAGSVAGAITAGAVTAGAMAQGEKQTTSVRDTKLDDTELNTSKDTSEPDSEQNDSRNSEHEHAQQHLSDQLLDDQLPENQALDEEEDESDQFDTLMEIDEEDFRGIESPFSDDSLSGESFLDEPNANQLNSTEVGSAEQTLNPNSQDITQEDSLLHESKHSEQVQDRQQRLFDDAESVDDLKCIHGIGPVIEQSLNDIGITSFQQIARLTRKEVQEIADILEIFPGRIERDNWIGSARKLVSEELEEA